LSDTKTSENWLVKHAEAEAKKDVIPFSERAGNIIGIVGVLLVVLFFAVHQMQSTGFFTSSFSTAEMLLLYLSLVAGMITTAIRALFGRKNLARLFDVFGACFFTVTLTWLYIVFPFSFTHFADVLTDFLKFLLQWISNDIARTLMIIGIVAAPVMAIYNFLMYMLVRRELSKQTQKTA
jgi:cytochrome bd-type quinol oxidase subunit 2